MRELLHKLSIVLFFIYVCSVYICSFVTELNMISIVIFIIFFGIAFFYIALRGNIIIPKAFSFYFAFLFIVILSSYWVILDYSSVQRITTLSLLMLVSLLVINITTDENIFGVILNMLFFAGIAMCIYSLIFYGYENTMLILSEETVTRLGGEISEENIFGMICAITATIGLYFAYYEKKVIYYFITLLPIVFTLASGSRMAFLMIFVAVMILIFLKRGKNIFSTLVIFALAITTIVVILNLFANSNIFIFKRFESLLNIFSDNNMEVADGSSITRLNMMKDGIKWFLKKPILGYGTDQYGILYLQKYGGIRHSHSNIIEVLVNYGIVGFIAYYGLYVYAACYIIKAVRKKIKYSVCLLMIFGAMVIAHIFYVLLYLKLTYIIVGIMLAYITINKKKIKEPNS